MFENRDIKKLIVVCNEKTREYASYLVQLISANDDNGEKIIGTKDGTVEAVVWLEKEYENNRATLSSNDHILFIGKSKFIKNESAHINIKFDEYGMQCGWLGKRACMCVHKRIATKKEYDNFFKLWKKYQNDAKRSNPNFFTAVPSTLYGTGVLFAPIITVPIFVFGIVYKSIKGKIIIDQQYTCLTTMFYLDKLQKFLEE